MTLLTCLLLLVQDPDRRILQEQIQSLTEAIRESPDKPSLYVERAEKQLQLGDPAKAIADLDGALRLDPKSAGTYKLRGLARFVWARDKAERDESPIDDCDRACADFDEAWKLDAEDDGIMMLKGHALVLKGDHTKDYNAAEAVWWEAKGMYDRAWTLNKDRVGTYVGRAHAYRAASRHGEARDRVEAALDNVAVAIKLEPEEGTHYLLRASIHREAGDDRKAAADYEKALALGCADVASMTHFGGKAKAVLDEKIAAEKNETVARRLKRLRQRLADVERKAGTLATEIGQLIEALSDDSIEKRDEARVKLVTIGEAALPALEKAAAGDSAEVRAHARAIAASSAGRSGIDHRCGESPSPPGGREG